MDTFLSIQWQAPVVNDSAHFICAAQFYENSAAFAVSHGYYELPWAAKSREKEAGKEDLQADPFAPATAGNLDLKLLKRETRPGFKTGEVIITHPPEPFARFSSLTAFQQRNFFRLLLKFRKDVIDTTPDGIKELRSFRELQAVALPEQQEYIAFAMQMALKHKEIYEFLDASIHNYIKDAWKARLDAVSNYHQSYTPKDIFPIMGRHEDTQFKRLATVLELGSVPVLKIVPPNKPFLVTKPSSKFTARFPPDPRALIKNGTRPTLFKTPISKDTNAASLALANKANIVMSASALATLVNNIGGKYEQNWTVPVVIKGHANWATGDAKPVKIIYIDKPLPPKTLSAVEKNKWYYKYAAKYHLSMPACPFVHKLSTERTNAESRGSDRPGNTVTEAKLFKEGASDIAKEEPPENSLASPAMTEEGNVVEADWLSEESDGGERLLMNDPNVVPVYERRRITRSVSKSLVTDKRAEQSPFPKKLKLQEAKEVTQEESISQPVESVLDVLLQKQTVLLTSDKSVSGKLNRAKQVEIVHDEQPSNKEAPGNYTQPLSRHNLSYTLWELRDSEDSFRLLLRSKYDACLARESKPVMFSIVPKLDYQPWYGGDFFSSYDLVKQYVKTYLHPGSHIRRVRIDPYSSKYIMAEQKDQAQLTSEVVQLLNTPISPALWGRLLHILKQLRNLAPGNYILQHETKTGPFVNLMEAKENGSYDLHSTYTLDTSITAPNLVAPFQIDPNCITPVHRALNKPPCLFEPFTDINSKKQLERGKRKKKKSKPGKGGQKKP